MKPKKAINITQDTHSGYDLSLSSFIQRKQPSKLTEEFLKHHFKGDHKLDLLMQSTVRSKTIYCHAAAFKMRLCTPLPLNTAVIK